MLNIVGHSVKIRDLGLLQYLYPNYIILDKPVLFSDKPIIFIGETKYLNSIKELEVDYIIVTELAEIDLTDRRNLLDVVFSKYNRPVPKYLQEFYNDLDEDTFIDLVKRFWLTGKWELKEYNNMGVFIEFLSSFKTDTFSISKKYLELLNNVGSEYIETSILTFISKVTNERNIGLSKWYMKTINDYKINKGRLIEKAINRYIESPIYNSELRTFNLILDMNRK